ncbi:hypothetical protein ACH5A3_36285 [Streptomyces echinatus]|uniref:hypothetical protein n=1 Tax=Streptomyces echinatus TaxID=67293 RepID=UPI003797B087
MTHNDKPINGQDNPSFLDLLNQTPPVPPALELEGKPGTRRLARLRAAWKESWEEGCFLYQGGVPTGSLSGPWPMLSHLSR